MIRAGVAGRGTWTASDVISAGRVGYGAGEQFAFASMRSQFEVRIDGSLVVLDRLVACDPEDIAALPHLWGGRTHTHRTGLAGPRDRLPDLGDPSPGDLRETRAPYPETMNSVLGPAREGSPLLPMRRTGNSVRG
jgi:UreD urease accessory protein